MELGNYRWDHPVGVSKAMERGLTLAVRVGVLDVEESLDTHGCWSGMKSTDRWLILVEERVDEGIARRKCSKRGRSSRGAEQSGAARKEGHLDGQFDGVWSGTTAGW